MLQSGSPPGRSIRSTRGGFATLLCSFLVLHPLWRFRVTPRRPREAIFAGSDELPCTRLFAVHHLSASDQKIEDEDENESSRFDKLIASQRLSL
jgi:hypothetical protein